MHRTRDEKSFVCCVKIKASGKHILLEFPVLLIPIEDAVDVKRFHLCTETAVGF